MGVIIYPEKIKPNDTIAITAVSMPANVEKIDLAIDNLKELELKVIETKNVRSDGIVSSEGKERAEELLELYKNPDVKYIIAARGGEFLMEMLPYLDEHKDIIKNNPKWFQGFSDPSLLNLYITTNFNIATIRDNYIVSAGAGFYNFKVSKCMMYGNYINTGATPMQFPSGNSTTVYTMDNVLSKSITLNGATEIKQ